MGLEQRQSLTTWHSVHMVVSMLEVLVVVDRTHSGLSAPMHYAGAWFCMGRLEVAVRERSMWSIVINGRVPL